MWVLIQRIEAGVYQAAVCGVRGEGGIETWEKYIDKMFLIKRLSRKKWSVCSWDGEVQIDLRWLWECKDFLKGWTINREWTLHKEHETRVSHVQRKYDLPALPDNQNAMSAVKES